MADRQSQGLQIALIASVMLNIVVGVVAYLMWRQYDEARTSATASEKKASDAQQTASSAQADAVKLKDWMGFASTASIDAIGKDKDDEMTNVYASVFGQSYPQSDRVYRKVIRTFYDTIKNRDKAILDEQDLRKKAETDVTNLRAELAAKVKAEEDNTASVQRDLKNRTDEFTQARKDVLAQRDEEAGKKKVAIDEANVKVAELQGTIAAGNSEIDRRKRREEDLKHQLEEDRKQTFEEALGKIISANQATKTVYINLGQADALNRLATFSVYDAKTTDVSRGGKKGTIEVTQLLEPHMAEARIVDAKLGDPILAGDVIYTPIWRPGQQRHFALAGLIDVDGDNKSDLELVRRLITMNGGVVDSFREGNRRTGTLSERTDYLVIGKIPDEKSLPAERTDFTNVVTVAERLLVKKIDLKDLLAQMGWKPDTNLQKYGPGYRPQDFVPKAPPGSQRVSTGNVSPLFKPRQPRSTAASTY